MNFLRHLNSKSVCRLFIQNTIKLETSIKILQQTAIQTPALSTLLEISIKKMSKYKFI